jgi:hemin uptake protein HemP
VRLGKKVPPPVDIAFHLGENDSHPHTKANAMSPTAAPPPPAPAAESPQYAAPAGRVLDSRAILGRQQEVTIRHHDETYRLRETRQGKLILTK